MLVTTMGIKTISHGNSQTRIRMYAAMLLAIMLFSIVTMFFAPNVGLVSARAENVFDNIQVDNDGNVNIDAKDKGGEAATFGSILTKYKTVCTFILSIVTITMIIFLIIQFTKLGAAGDNQASRKQAIGGILTTGIATALLGSLTIWFGFFYNAIS